MQTKFANLPLSGRIILGIAVAMFIATLFSVIATTGKSVTSAQEEIAHLVELNKRTIPAMIAEAAVVGDYGSIREMLIRHAKEGHLAAIRYRDKSGEAISVVNEIKPNYPEWFARQIPLEDESVTAHIEIGGVKYGSVDITLPKATVIEPLWHSISHNVTVLAVFMLLQMVLAYLIVTRNVRRLRILSKSVKEFGRGGDGKQIEAKGPPEIRALIEAFNDMATSIKGAKHAMTRERDRFKGLTKLSSDWYWEQDENFRFTMISDGVRATGTEPEYFLGKTRWDLPIELAKDDLRHHIKTLDMRQPFVLEYCLTKANNEKVWFSIKGEPIFEDGKFTGYRGLGVDITASKQALENQALAASVFKSSNDGILITDAKGNIVDVNPAFEHLTGYRREEVIGKRSSLLKSGRHTAEFYHGLWNALLTTGKWKGELWNRRKNGEIYAELLTISSVKSVTGQVIHYVGVFSDITSIKNQQKHLELAASHDALTQLPNRVRLYEDMRKAISAVDRTGQQLAVCYIDLDGFKPINDSYGHMHGDQLLIEVAERLQAGIRPHDMVARLGGDEFVLLLTELDSQQECQKAVMRILTNIARPYMLPDQGTAVITASIGVTIYPHDDSDTDGLLRHADQAMYQAKREGKNRVSFFDPTASREIGERMEIVNKFALGLDNEEMVLFYQPKVDMRSGEVNGLEALIRWQHPERGLLPPAEFLGAIEGSKVAIRTAYWVIERALSQMDEWMLAGLRLPVSVNLPGQLLLHENFTQHLKTMLDRYPDIAPSMLQMEILESEALENISQAQAVIKECQAMGVTFALDDFGTGYSSLTYLKRLGIDVLKIDQSFVRTMLTTPEDFAIVGGVVGLSEAFGCAVVSEGVETIEHGTMLLRLGCVIAQGYGVARPMSAKDVPAWVRQWKLPDEWEGVTRWSHEHVPLLEAEIYHRQWVDEVRHRAGGNPAVKELLGVDKCRFGQWLAGKASERFRTHHLYQEIARTHGEIHRLGSMALETLASEAIEPANVELQQLIALRDHLVGCLHEIAGEPGRERELEVEVA